MIFNAVFSYHPKLLGITMHVNGRNKTLYISTVRSIEEQTRPNLSLTLEELNVINGQELSVADQTNPNTVTIRIKYNNAMELN